MGAASLGMATDGPCQPVCASFEVPGKRHPDCTQGSEWEDVLKWKEECPPRLLRSAEEWLHRPRAAAFAGKALALAETRGAGSRSERLGLRMAMVPDIAIQAFPGLRRFPG